MKFQIGDRVIVVKEPKITFHGNEKGWTGVVVELPENHPYPVICDMSENGTGEEEKEALRKVGYKMDELLHITKLQKMLE